MTPPASSEPRSRAVHALFTCLLLSAALAAPAAQLEISHVNVVDVASARIRRDMTVIVRDGRIAEVRKARRGNGPTAGVTVIDGRGRFLIPGLWDMHAHIRNPERDFKLLVANGVLGVRDMGGVSADIFRWREEVALGRLNGPRIVACGPIIDGPQPTNPPISIAATDAATGRAAVRQLKAAGADFVKVHDGVSEEAYMAIAAEAQALGLPLAGHVPVRVRTLDAVRAGQRSIEHQIGFRAMSLAEDQVMQIEANDDTFARAMRSGNFSLIPESIARKGNLLLDRFSEERAVRFYHAIQGGRTYLTPTLVTNRSLTFIDEISRREDPRTRYYPADVVERWKPESGMLTRYRTPAYISWRKRDYAKTLEQIPVAHRHGVLFLAGTDMTLPWVFAGFSLHDELELFVQAGLTPAQALQAATVNPVKYLGMEREARDLQAGMPADLVLLEGNPLEDITASRKIAAVVLRGNLMRRDTLDEMLRAVETAARTKGNP